MKKIILLLVSILLVVSLTGCGEKKDVTSEVASVEESVEEKNPLEGQIVKEFKAKDLEGNEVTNDIFSENNMTVVNIWGTFCGPCVEEMPELDKLQKELKDKKVKVVGIVSDKAVEEAKNITKEISYTNIIPDEVLENQIVNRFDYVPVTLFVNNKGEIMKKFIPGGSDYETFKKIIEELLEKK
ncbi:TlpA family protein disulfide reductase [Crassaminicella profunda]|uniref:TlpA family protein disulfide reductase n=1 Tax=Crassaminicella profunda TaxID=1286698 RepID=UPI001CA6B6A8|nr:TlpA disulfide reductase family protein [Crassaminicella profunda]QZY53666.1 TlpA family protein disulfide reductase [Crassaminicella profunda]